MKYLLKNGTVVTGEKSEQLDILVEGEKIVQVGKNLPSKDAQEIDVSGKLLFPGFIDGHTHFDLEVAGTVTADDFETGTKAAILGGTTFVIDYASQDKGGHTLKEGLDKWHKKADGKCSCDYSFHMSIVEWNDKTEAEVQDMIDPDPFRSESPDILTVFLLQTCPNHLWSASGFFQSLNDFVLVLCSIRFQGYLKFNSLITVSTNKLIVFQLNNITLIFGNDRSNTYQFTRLVRNQDGNGKD